MAFKARLEFWKITSGSEGTKINVLDAPVAPAVEVVADMGDGVALPVLSNRENYAISVIGVTGDFVVEVAETPTQDQDYGRLVTEGSVHWLIARPGQEYFITEYVAA